MPDNWKPEHPLSRSEYNYFIDLLTSVAGQITAVKKRISMMETDLNEKIKALQGLPHE